MACLAVGASAFALAIQTTARTTGDLASALVGSVGADAAAACLGVLRVAEADLGLRVVPAAVAARLVDTEFADDRLRQCWGRNSRHRCQDQLVEHNSAAEWAAVAEVCTSHFEPP